MVRTEIKKKIGKIREMQRIIVKVVLIDSGTNIIISVLMVVLVNKLE